MGGGGGKVGVVEGREGGIEGNHASVMKTGTGLPSSNEAENGRAHTAIKSRPTYEINPTSFPDNPASRLFPPCNNRG